jgi:probable F420-dependent oxidoreductase
VKVRIGVGMGALGGDPAELCGLVDDLDDLGFDSLWLPEVLTAPTLDPLTALAFAAAHNPRLKFGTTLLLPGRNLVRVAKQLATLDRLSAGRLLVTFVPGLTQSPESGAVGVPPKAKGPQMEEAFPLLRRLWAGETVDHHGALGDFEGVTLSPLPAQEPLEFWTGGMVPAALVRCGRYADGWLPSSCTPAEVPAARDVIDEAASTVGREISREHFGVSVAYAPGPLDDKLVTALARGRKGVDPREVVPAGLDGLKRFLEAFLQVGFSKFVVRPLVAPESWRAEFEALAGAVADLQT